MNPRHRTHLPKSGRDSARRPSRTLGPRAQKAVDFLRRDLWLTEVRELPWPKRTAMQLSRVVVLAARGFHQHRALMQAAALTYYTVLSIVPVLAVSFAVARGLGAYDDLKERAVEPFLDRFLSSPAVVDETAALDDDLVGPTQPPEELAPGMGPPSEEPATAPDFAEDAVLGSTEPPSDIRVAADKLLELVDKTNDLPLGMLGLALFLYSAIKLISAVERSLNEVWGIQRGRTWMRRVSDYVAIVVITPVLLLVGTTGMAAVRAARNSKPSWNGHELDIGWLVGFLLQGVPLMTFFLGLTFAYIALPNTRVRMRSAMLGGAAAALLWLGSQYLYIELQVGIAKYNALYAGFAAFPILLVWIFLSWAIFLTGAELCYAHQSVPTFTSIARMGTVDQQFRESLALRLCGRIADAFLTGAPARESAELATEIGISPRAVNGVLERLVEHGILARTDHDEDRYLPARDPESVTVLDVLTAMRTETGAESPTARGKLDERVDRILAGMEREASESLFNHTLRELALTSRATESEGAPSTTALGEATEGAQG